MNELYVTDFDFICFLLCSLMPCSKDNDIRMNQSIKFCEIITSSLQKIFHYRTEKENKGSMSLTVDE